MLTDEQMRDVLKNTNHMVRNSMHGPFWPELEEACRAIEDAATEPLLQRIAELESQLDEAKNGASALAKKWWARHCETNRHMETTREAHEDFCQLERAIRALKGAKE